MQQPARRTSAHGHPLTASSDLKSAIKLEWKADTLMHTSRVAATKRATVRIGVYSRTLGRFLQVSSERTCDRLMSGGELPNGEGRQYLREAYVRR